MKVYRATGERRLNAGTADPELSQLFHVDGTNNRFYPLPQHYGSAALTTTAFNANNLYVHGFKAPPAVATLEEIALTPTIGVAANCVFGLYSNRLGYAQAESYPGDLLAQSAAVSLVGASVKKGTIGYRLEPGRLYWAAVVLGGAITGRSIPFVDCISTHNTSLAGPLNMGSYTRAFTYSATLPDRFPTGGSKQSVNPTIILGLRFT